MTMTKKYYLEGTVVLALFFFTSHLYANFGDTWGISAGGIARGNAMTAVVSGWSSAYYNMAGLAKTKYEKNSFCSRFENPKNQLAVSYLMIRPRMDISYSGTEADKYLDIEMATLGISTDLAKYIFVPDVFDALVFGLALGASAGKKMMVMNDLDPETHNFLRYGREAQGLVLCAGVGMGFGNGLWGIGLGLNMSAGGEGEMYMPDIDIVPVESSPNTSMRVDMKGSVSPNIGIFFNPGDTFRRLRHFEFGVSYRGETYIDMDPFKGDMALLDQAIEMNVYMTIAEFYTPSILSFGVAYTMNDMTLSFDYEFQKWSGFEHGNSRKLYYQRRVPPVLLPEFDDIIVYKAGVSYKYSDTLNILGGFMYQPGFVSDEDTENLFNLLDNTKQIFSAGAEMLIKKGFFAKHFKHPLQINVALQYQKLKDEKVKKDRENNYKVDKTDEEDVDYYWENVNPDYIYGGSVFSLSMEVVVRN